MWDIILRTHLAYTICMAMSGNGVPIAGIEITRVLLLTVGLGLRVESLKDG